MKKKILLPELLHHLETLLTPELFTDYCPNGLQVEGKKEIRKIATAVSANLKTIEICVEKGFNALIVHHGIFWKGETFPIVGVKKAKLELLLANNISLLAYHLPLDAHQEIGNNWKAASDLGWKELTPFGGIGVQGQFKPVAFSDFVELLEKYYGQKAVIAGKGKKIVSSCALISGGAYKELGLAAKVGVDAFITGNFDEPAWWVAEEEKIHFLALGHTSTEKVGPKALALYLRKKLGISCEFIEQTNPF